MAKTNDIDEYINKQSQNFNLWITGINNYLDYRYSDEELQSDELWEVTTGCVDSFIKIAELCLRHGKFKDSWDYDNYYQHIYGPELIIKSLKTEIDYRLGLDNKGIYLSADLRYNENLRYMDDNYWKLLLNLSEFDGFIYEEYEFINDERVKQFPDLFKTNKSMIYRIMRKYIFDSTETDPRYRSGSVGELKILFPLNEKFDKIVKTFCLAFKVMYQLNYDLWKISNLKSKKTRPI